MTVTELVHNLIKVVSKNGNMLLNVGPAADGTIHPLYVDRLIGIGDWLQVNGEAIYGTTIWNVCQNETASSVFYTRRADRLYVHFTQWPKNSILRLDCPVSTMKTKATMLGYPSELRTTDSLAVAGIAIELPKLTPDMVPCQHAWVVVLTGLGNLSLLAKDV